ncbi:MAG: helix-turn-helix domain-containing protein [Terracidiphilus sp.]|jgi:cytoskeletal protein RodZ
MKTKENPIMILTGMRARFIVKEENISGSIPVFWSSMGSFGEDLRMERLSRGVALEEITAVTKISQHHLVALEQDRFRLLPGGILSKGIVRGYTGALGLDQHDWTERFLKAYVASGQVMDDDRSWMAFASNVGKARILRHDAVEIRLRWLGAILLLLVVAIAGFLTVRYFGVRAGWWSNLLPWPRAAALSHTASSHLDVAVSRVQAWLGR